VRLSGALERAWAALGIYGLFSVLVLGRGVILEPAEKVVGDTGADKTIYIWSLVWWPHALTEGMNPFHTDLVWAPEGADLTWVTAVPGAALLAWPVTALFGPLPAYNLLALAAPALAAWTAFLLAREVGARFWPALVGGYLFGFSSFEVQHTIGHLNLVLIFLIPLCGWLAARRWSGQLGRWPFVGLLGLALAFQFLFSTELFLTLTIVGVVVGVILLWRLRDRLVLRLAKETTFGYVVAGILVSPYLLHAFFVAGAPTRAINSPFEFAADVLNFVIPARRVWLRPPGSESVRELFTGNAVEQTAYLGLPLIAIVVLSIWAARRRPALTISLLSLAAVALLALGARPRVGGQIVAIGPWALFANLPLAEHALPVRLTLYVALFAGLVTALWLSAPSRRPLLKWGLALLAVVSLLPNPSTRLWASEVPRSTLFTKGDYERFLRPGEVALVLPYGGRGWALAWQAEEDMRFRLVGGHLGEGIPKEERRWRPIYRALAGSEPLENPGPQFRRFLDAHGVRAVIVAPPGPKRYSARLLVSTLPKPIRVRDAQVYVLDGTAAPAASASPSAALAASARS
jgi:hypothetical protein